MARDGREGLRPARIGQAQFDLTDECLPVVPGLGKQAIYTQLAVVGQAGVGLQDAAHVGVRLGQIELGPRTDTVPLMSHRPPARQDRVDEFERPAPARFKGDVESQRPGAVPLSRARGPTLRQGPAQSQLADSVGRNHARTARRLLGDQGGLAIDQQRVARLVNAEARTSSPGGPERSQCRIERDRFGAHVRHW